MTTTMLDAAAAAEALAMVFSCWKQPTRIATTMTTMLDTAAAAAEALAVSS